MESTATKPLFGGALTASLPANWLDASDVRPVPDHQEVWTEREGERSLVVEILERAEASDAECAAFHFQDIADTNDATATSIVSHGALDVASLAASLHGSGPCLVLHGVQVLQKVADNLSSSGGGGNLSMQMAVIRLAPQATDILVSINRPCTTSSAAEHDDRDYALLFEIVSSLEVRDWSLFAG